MNVSTATVETRLQQAWQRFLVAGGRARRLGGQHTISSMPPFFATPRARFAWSLGGFVTNRLE